MANRFQKRAPTFEVGEIFAVKLMGEFFFVRVVGHEGDTAHVVTLPEGGFGDMAFQRKPSAVSRAVISAEEANELLTLLAEPSPDVPDRKTRFNLLRAAKKSMDPFEKASALGMLARRASTEQLYTDDKVLYRQLRSHVQLELEAALGATGPQASGLLASTGVPDL